MRKYEKEVVQAQLDNEKAVLKRLESNYKDALEEIDSKIAELLGRADADMQHVIYQVDYQRALRGQIQGILNTLQANEFQTVSEYLTKCYDEGFLGAMYSLQKQGVPLVIPIDQEQVAAAIQHETNLSTSLYKAFDTADLQKKIAGEISRGFATASSFAEIARNVSAYANISKNNAMRIIRTEGHRITETAAYHAQQKAKDRGADIVKIWDASLDAKTRPSHAKVDGEIKELEEKFSNGLMYPGDPHGSAAEVINCRCRSRTDARWALEADATKMLGDVSAMSDAQKEAIAKKLGIPAEDLEQYSGQIVPVNAKSYSDFKKQYNQLWHYENSSLKDEAEARIASYGKKGKTSTKAVENTGDGLEKFNKSGILNSRADPMAEAFGAGVDSNPVAIAAFKEELATAGVQLKERATEALGYCPGLKSGTPGTIYISEGASYSAWLHEMEHMRNDRDAGWVGMRIIADPDARYEWERRAYQLEIDLANSMGRPDIAEKLKENLEGERRTIYGEQLD